MRTWTFLAALLACAASAAAQTPMSCERKADAVPSVTCGTVATADRAATLMVQQQAGGAEALELTARPLVSDPATAYLVQVYVADATQREAGETTLLGSFSFLPPHIGQPQTFVLPSPSIKESGTGKNDLTVSVKLVAANKSRILKDAAVEIVGARLVK